MDEADGEEALMASEGTLILWATRPSAVAREGPIVAYLLGMGLREFVAVPISAELSEYWVDRDSYREILRNILAIARAEGDAHFSHYGEMARRLIESGTQLTAAVPSGNRQVLWERYRAYNAELEQFSFYMVMPFAVNVHIEERVQKALPAVFATLTFPGRPSAYQLMQRALLEKPPEEVAVAYGWLAVYNISETPYGVGYFRKLREELSPVEIEYAFREIAQNAVEFERMVGTITDSALKQDCRLLHDYAFIKTDRVDVWRRTQLELQKFFRYLAELLRWGIEEAINLAPEEIRAFLLESHIPDRAMVKLRAEKRCYFHYWNGTLMFVTDLKAQEEIQKRMEHERSAGELHGTVAVRGKAMGRVVVVNHEGEAAKIRNGDILIARYTTPNLTPYMRKCAAFVTDEGGLTSHAAIIARELKKPCVIGTKNATQVLKDGDLVEVDANTGIVRKL